MSSQQQSKQQIKSNQLNSILSTNNNNSTNNISKDETISKEVNLWKIRELAIADGGLLNDSIRRVLWPKLLGLNPYYNTNQHLNFTNNSNEKAGGKVINVGKEKRTDNNNSGSKKENEENGQPSTNTSSTSTIPNYSLDHLQISRDVKRVTWHLLTTTSQRTRNIQMKNKSQSKRLKELLKRKQKKLGDYLNLVLCMSYLDDGSEAEVLNGTAVESLGSGIVDSLNDMAAVGSSTTESEGGGVYDIPSITQEMKEENRLRYYQGYHDVASIILAVLGGVEEVGGNGMMTKIPTPPLPRVESAGSTATDSSSITRDGGGPSRQDEQQQVYNAASSMGLTLACRVLLQLSHSHLRDAMRPNFAQLQSALKLIIMPLTATFDPQLHAHLHDCEMEPYFCLSWVITWFSHDVRDTALVKRLFDFFIVSHPLMVVYMSVAMMIHPLNRIEVLSADCDFACVHNALADLPKNSSNVGWRYLPGENPQSAAGGGTTGYVTGEEDDMLSCDPSLQDQSIDDGDGSVVSIGGSRSSRPRVPFQELIDLSISLMHKVPPRNLLNLAQRYHTEITLQPLMAQASSIALLQPPPSWGLASSADADWVIRQRMREEYGLTKKKKLNRHQRKKKLKLSTAEASSSSLANKSSSSVVVSTDLLLFDKPSIQALIASGTGPDGRLEARKLRKKRRRIVQSLAVVLVSVLVAYGRRKYYISLPSSSLTGVVLSSSSVPAAPSDLSDVTVSASQQQRQHSSTAHHVLPQVEEKKPRLSNLTSIQKTHLASLIQEEEPQDEEIQKQVNVQQRKRYTEQPEEELIKEEDDVVDKMMSSLSYFFQQIGNEVKEEAGDDATDNSSSSIAISKQREEKTRHQQQPPPPPTREGRSSRMQQSVLVFLVKLMNILTKLTNIIKISWRHAIAVWSVKVAPKLINTIKTSCHTIKDGWLKIAPTIESEFTYELDSVDNVEYTEDVKKIWKKQADLYKRTGKKVASALLKPKKLFTKKKMHVKR